MAALTAQQLLKLDDGDFNSKIQDMSVKVKLLEFIEAPKYIVVN
jgi:hypothetical protein